MATLAREYVRWVHEDEAWARTLIREALDGGFPVSDERVGRLVSLVESTRLRQKQGEIRSDIDVGALSLVLLAASIAPAVLPGFAHVFVGLDPSSEEFHRALRRPGGRDDRVDGRAMMHHTVHTEG